MKKHIGNLIIEKYDKRDFSKLEEVTGYLSIYSNATLNALTTVGGDLYIYSNATLNALTTVGGYLSIYSNATLNADALTTVGGYLYINSNATLKIEFLKNKNWKSVDNRLFIIESEKNSKGIKIYSGYNLIGLEKNKPKKEQCFVSEKNGFFAHGETIKKSVSDLQFKIISETLKNEPIKKDTIIDVKYYRLVTGACQQGCDSFIQANGLKNDKYKAFELLPILEKANAYGLLKFKSLINF